MSKALERVEELRGKMSELREEMAQQAKDAFHECVRDLFEEHPTLIEFSWRQFTPYFNDGDTCYFGARTGEIGLRTADDESEEFGNYDTYDWVEGEKVQKDLTPFQKAGLAALAVLEAFDEDNYESMFGDHCKIVVTREGVEVNDYSDHH